MKVLMINVLCGVKSTGRICTDLADILEEEGNEVRVAYGREEVPEKYKKISYKIGSDLDVYLHAAKSLLFDSCGFESKHATKKLVDYIKQYNPDVIHLHNLHGYYLNIEILFEYLRICGKKIIWTLHDCWAFTGHCSHFSILKCEQWKSHCSYCKQIREYPKCILKSNVFANFDRKKRIFTAIPNLTMVTPSQWLADRVKESFLGSYNVIAIPNGVDLDQFKPMVSSFRDDYGLTDKKIILGVATAWGIRKGLDEFRQLAERLDENYKVVLVGLTKKQAEALPNTILKIERTNCAQELATIYTAADVFLNLGKEETMGLTTVEAMACGTPVLVSNMTAVPEVVDQRGGMVLSEMTIEAIIEGIHTVLSKSYTDTRSNALRYEKKQQYLKYIDLYKGWNR